MRHSECKILFKKKPGRIRVDPRQSSRQYMLLIADDQTARDFADYGQYTDYEYLQAIEGTDERAFRHQVSVETEEKARAR